MSSTSTIPRLKPRGGSSTKITASLPTTTKTLTPLSHKPATKPNPRSASGPAHKPTIRPIPRSDGLDSRPKSRPRGRTPSPSDFRNVRVSDKNPVNGKENGVCFGGKSQSNGQRFRKESELCGKDVNFSDKSQSSGQRSRKESDLCGKDRSFSDKSHSNGQRSRKESELCGKDGCCRKESEVCGKDGSFNGNGRGENGVGFSDKSQTNGQRHIKESDLSDKDRNPRGCDANVTIENRVLESSKGKGVNGEGAKERVGSNKNASKLHEKLAYLEGKVKRIASDIKKTKELLDSNNTDASKLILSDIQEKISGIEKAMGNVIVDSSLRVSTGRSSCSGDTVKASVKGLSDEELKARLLPHQKLLRDRALLKAENSVNNVEEDPIEMEFLASLNKVEPEISVASKNGTVHIGDEVKETEETDSSNVGKCLENLGGNKSAEVELKADEQLDEFYDQENKPAMIVGEEIEDVSIPQLIELGRKTSTGGWFVSEGESVLLAHDDGSCSFYDIANQEEKAEYRPPSGISQNIWRDCWIIRAPGADGCSGKYVVAASAGNTMDSGFCSWDFYTKEVQAFHTEDYKTAPRVALGPLPDNLVYRRNALGGIMSSENLQWWYRPCGPLIVSTASSQRGVKVFDIRDGEEIMKWNVQKPVSAMDYCSPLQWRNRGKVVVAETEAVSMWDVSSLNPQPLCSVSTPGDRILALHVNNTDAELGGGVRQRVSSSEAEGNDGVFCTSDSINILDFRNPSGIGLKIPKTGLNFESLSSRGDSVYLGCTTITSTTKKQVSSSQVLQFSLRNQKILNTYTLPESNAHSHHRALTQVWGNSNLVMAVCGLGLFVFDTLRDDITPSFAMDCSSQQQKVREVIGPDDLYSPSFDYISSQVLLISRDRPAMWRHLE